MMKTFLSWNGRFERYHLRWGIIAPLSAIAIATQTVDYRVRNASCAVSTIASF
jgi:hypothetical protein